MPVRREINRLSVPLRSADQEHRLGERRTSLRESPAAPAHPSGGSGCRPCKTSVNSRLGGPNPQYGRLRSGIKGSPFRHLAPGETQTPLGGSESVQSRRPHAAKTLPSSPVSRTGTPRGERPTLSTDNPNALQGPDVLVVKGWVKVSSAVAQESDAPSLDRG
jgi:hypothetical protein